MSLVPLIFSDWWEDLERPHSVYDQNFGLGLLPEQLVTPSRLELYLQSPQAQLRRAYPSSSSAAAYLRPWAELLRAAEKGGASTVQADKDAFQVTLDVQQFRPDEIDVKVKDRYVIVNAKHEEKKDEHGWVSREFTRKYLIPEQCDIEQVASKLSSDGVLTVLAPRKPQPKDKKEKVIKIEHTGKPAMKGSEETKKVEQKKEEEKKEEKKK